MPFINLYAILEVENFASIKAVTKAFRKKALTAHPDRNKSADPAEFHKLLEAYEELKDPAKKALHDSRLRIISSVSAAGVRRKRSLFSDMYFSFTPRPRAAPPPKRPRQQFGYPSPWFTGPQWTCDLGFKTNNDPAFNGRRNGWTFQSEAWGRDGLSSSGGEADTELNRRWRSRRQRPPNSTRFSSPRTRRKRNRSTSSTPSRPKVTINLVPEDLTGEPSSMGNPIDLTDDSPREKPRSQTCSPRVYWQGSPEEPQRVDNTTRNLPVDLTWSETNPHTIPKTSRVDLCSDKEDEKPIDLTQEDEVKQDSSSIPLKDRTNDHYCFEHTEPRNGSLYSGQRRHKPECFQQSTSSSPGGSTPLINLTCP